MVLLASLWPSGCIVDIAAIFRELIGHLWPEGPGGEGAKLFVRTCYMGRRMWQDGWPRLMPGDSTRLDSGSASVESIIRAQHKGNWNWRASWQYISGKKINLNFCHIYSLAASFGLVHNLPLNKFALHLICLWFVGGQRERKGEGAKSNSSASTLREIYSS